MRNFGVLVIVLAGALVKTSLALGAEGQGGGGCNLDATTKASILTLPFASFDQQEGSGWRPLYEARCYRQAAELLIEYMQRNPELASQQYILPFHTGQMLALAGHYDKAIEYMQRSYQRTPQTLINWDAYVTATISFLQKDRPELIRQRDLIDQQPPMRPGPGVPDSMVGKKVNLDVVDRFVTCFDESYEVAFRDGCESQSD